MTTAHSFIARLDGTDINFIAPADMTLLQAAKQAEPHGFNLQSSCRNGTCRTCMCQLVAGHVAYRIEWPGLSMDEKRDGLILACVAYPLTDVVIQRIE